MMMFLKRSWQLFISLFNSWLNEDISFKAAGLTYYSLLAIVPLLSLLITISSILINENFVVDELANYVSVIFSEPVANRLNEFVYGLVGADYSVLLSIGGLVALLFAVTTYFSRLVDVTRELVLEKASDKAIVENVKNRLHSSVFAFLIFFFIATLSLLQGVSDNIDKLVAFNFTSGLVLELMQIFIWLGSIILLSAFVALYYWVTVGEVIDKFGLILQSLMVSLVIYLLNLLFSEAISFSATYRDYGIFSATMAVILWLYLLNTIILLGAILIKEYKKPTALQ